MKMLRSDFFSNYSRLFQWGNIAFILLISIVSSCNNPLKKKIWDPLSVDELKKEMRKDTSFENTYKYIQYVKDSFLKADIDKVKWADLTYRRVHKILTIGLDTNYFTPLKEKLKEEWAAKYKKYLPMIDSASAWWKKYKKENSLEQYISIELASIDKEYYEYIGGIRAVNLGFRLSPLQGPIEQVRFNYRIEAKINEQEEKSSSYESVYSTLDKSWCLTTSPFAKPIVRYWEPGYSNKNIFESKTLETFSRDYNIYIEVGELRKDGVNHSKDDLNIPESLVNYWEYENREYLKDMYLEDVAKEVLKVNFMKESSYISHGIDSVLMKKDSVAFEFVRLKYYDYLYNKEK